MARHHSSKKHNSRKDERAHHRMGQVMGHEHYAGAEPRRRQEMEDAGMIREDHNAIANLPQQVIYRPYPMPRQAMPEDALDDTMRGIDHQIALDEGKLRQHLVPKKV